MNRRLPLIGRGYDEHGEIFSLKLGPKRAAVLIGAENHEVFFGETDKALSFQKPYKFLAAMFGEVGFTAPPEVYKEQRPILMEPFKGGKMPRYVEVMQYEIRKWLDALGSEGEMEFTSEVNALVQQVAGHALMGRDFHESVGTEFWKLYEDLSGSIDVLLPPNLPLPKFRRRDRARKKMEAILQPIIDERRAHPGLKDDFLQTFVDQRYKDGRPVEDKVIIGLIIALMFAGHETTAGQGAWTVIQLLQNPDYLKLVESEISVSLPFSESITAAQMAPCQHLWWALKETERMKPPADLLMRMADEEVTVGNYRIPAGWLVTVISEKSHYLPELFADAESYDPFRFGPDRREDTQHRYAMIGFGGGSHKCVGMNFANNEIFLITALLFQEFELELLTRDPDIKRGVGANRPMETRIRYRRRSPEEICDRRGKAEMPAEASGTCPHAADSSIEKEPAPASDCPFH